MVDVLGISGSPRKSGNSDMLLERVLKGVRDEGRSTDTAALRDFAFQSCIGCERCRDDKHCTGLQDDMQLIYPKISDSKGLVIVSPVHSYTVTALVKAFLDRLYCYYDFSEERPGPVASRLAGQGRKAVIAAVCEQRTTEESGIDTTLVVLRRNIQMLGYDIVGELTVFGVFPRGGVLKQSEALEEAGSLGRTLASAFG